LANNIHSSAFIGPLVTMGDGNRVGPNVIIEGNCEIGDNNWFGANSYIGAIPELRNLNHFDWSSFAGLRTNIGSENIIRENSLVQSSLDGQTTIGDRNFLMVGTHVSHDCKIGDEITLAQKVILAGHTSIQSYSNIGTGAVIKQKLSIGQYVMVGMGSVVTKNLPPFGLYYGNPCKYIRPNERRLSTIESFSPFYYNYVSLDSSHWPTDAPPQITSVLFEYESKLDSSKN